MKLTGKQQTARENAVGAVLDMLLPAPALAGYSPDYYAAKRAQAERVVDAVAYYASLVRD